VDGPELSCVVLSLADQPELVDAVRSLVRQSPQPEIVVVNSGGGDSAARLRKAGLDAPVINSEDRLLPGGARNAGVRATSGRYVAFLAADCRAEPGWVAGRLRRHREGAHAVGSVIAAPRPDTASSRASRLLLHPRRLAHTTPAQRLLYGLSYDRDLFERFGPFREDLRDGEDSDFNARFDGHARVTWADDVRTVHLNPGTPWSLVLDQHQRGRRSAAWDELPIWILLTKLLLERPLFALWQGLRAPVAAERLRVLAAAPLILAGALGHTSGCLARRLLDRP
jgi:glycosyltransferase involved in cell wall biosynthesis